MNLSTARSEKRAREVGVRKVLGANKASLFRQFIGESFVVCIIALSFAAVLAYLILPGFESVHPETAESNNSGGMVLWIGVLILFTGFLAGLYPAFYLSSFKPASVLKGKILNSFSALAIRKGLVVFQFTVSICLIFASLVIWRQLDLVNNQDLGFTKARSSFCPCRVKRKP